MKLTVNSLVASSDVLNELIQLDISATSSLKIARAVRKLEPELASFEDVRRKLIIRLGEQDEDGNYHLERLVVKAENQDLPEIRCREDGVFLHPGYCEECSHLVYRTYERAFMRSNGWVKVLPEVKP